MVDCDESHHEVGAEDQEHYLGHLDDYPDYETQGLSKEELVHNLRSLLEDIESGELPSLRPTSMASP